MTVLVVYASKHGATRQMAERIAGTLTAAGQPAAARSTEDAGNLAGYDAFVIGAAAYYGHWLKAVVEFTRTHQALLAARPVWLFSSGPLGTQTGDADGSDPREGALPQDLGQLEKAIGARGHRVFFGALDPNHLTLPERTARRLPAVRALLPEGDFREWDDIDSWAAAIAAELSGPQRTLPERPAMCPPDADRPERGRKPGGSIGAGDGSLSRTRWVQWGRASLAGHPAGAVTSGPHHCGPDAAFQFCRGRLRPGAQRWARP